MNSEKTFTSNSSNYITNKNEPCTNSSTSDRFGSTVSFQISKDAGAVNLINGLSDSEGFYVCLDSAATEGNLKVILYSDSTSTQKTIPFFKGWNPILLKAIIGGDAANTATNVYYGK